MYKRVSYKRRSPSKLFHSVLNYDIKKLFLSEFHQTKMNFTSLKFMLLIAATIVNAKPTQKSIASTQQPRQPRQPRQLLTANLKEKSIFLLELKWSDKATTIVKLESLGDIDEDCFYKGSYIEDSDR